ncbi:MAG: phosphohydrolase [Flavobacteriales bacterium]|nr:phosphohydrolase [Flavobacteriales bacterium]MBK7268027.1 phosphohydrolase [Flavobacteriales bacterium]
MNELIEQAEAHVRKYMADHSDVRLRYHDIRHVAQVAGAVRDLATAAQCTPDETTALIIAAWFHDSAFHLGAVGHEERSAQLASEFLATAQASPALIAQVRTLIMATKKDAERKGALEPLMRDADLVHLGGADHLDQTTRLREEVEALGGGKIKKKDWLAESIRFMESTPYLSEVAQRSWNAGREKNLALLRASLHERGAKKAEEKDRKSPASEEARSEKDASRKRKETERGVETLFRVTLNNHTRLSQIADNKANMMLSVNALIISVVLSGLAPKLENNQLLMLPAALLTFTCLASIVTATLATRPKVTQGNTSREEIEKRNANLLFFGNFHNMKYTDFKWGVEQVMNDRDYLYGSMTKDLYYLGKVLHKKYRYLNLTYSIFAIGLVLSVAAAARAAYLAGLTASGVPGH